MTIFVQLGRTLTAVTCGFAVLGLANPAQADVLEIGGDGAVTVYRAPAVYSSEGVRPIAAPAAPARSATAAGIAEAISQAAARHALSVPVLEAVAWRESRFRQTAVSPKGAVGVMQIMPATAQALGVDRYDLRQNIEGGAAYLRSMLNRYNGSLTLALAAYNAGPGAVDRYGGMPPFRETRSYVDAIVTRLAGSVVTLPPIPLIEP